MRSFDGLKTATIRDFNFLGKGTTQRVERLQQSGVIGLSPDPKYTAPFKRINQDRFLLNELKKQGIIDYPVFSLYVADFGFESKIRFGASDPKVIASALKEVPPYYKNLKSKDKLFWHETLGDNEWSLPIYQMIIP